MVFCLLVTVGLLVFLPDKQKVTNDTQEKIGTIQNDLQGILDKCDDIISLSKNAELVTRIEELTRENVVLRQEVENLKAQLKAASWYKEAEDIQGRFKQ
jgi:regulator of replication initiation timing